MRRAARTDANHADVREALRAAGWVVRDTSAIGGGFPDLVIGKRGRGVVFVEVKDGSKPPSERKLTPDEQRFAATWKAAGVDVIVVTSVEDAVRV